MPSSIRFSTCWFNTIFRLGKLISSCFSISNLPLHIIVLHSIAIISIYHTVILKNRINKSLGSLLQFNLSIHCLVFLLLIRCECVSNPFRNHPIILKSFEKIIATPNNPFIIILERTILVLRFEERINY